MFATNAAGSTGNMMTVAEVCTTLAISRATLYRWWEAGNGPAFIRLSARAVRVRRSDLDLFLAEKEYASMGVAA